MSSVVEMNRMSFNLGSSVAETYKFLRKPTRKKVELCHFL